MNKTDIKEIIQENLDLKKKLLQRVESIHGFCTMAVETLKKGGKIFFCGNGGSACDAAHASCELGGWFRKKARQPFPAVALGFETPLFTAIGNDKGYEETFARQLEALAKPGDMVVGISTSGKSPSILNALQRGRELGLKTVALVGAGPSPAADMAEFSVEIPSNDTPRIQECHILVLHILCEFLEAELPSREVRS